MTFTATKMADTLFETARDDKRARLKLKSSYLDHLKATSPFKDARFLYLNNNTNVLTTFDSDNEKLDGCDLSLDTVTRDQICSGFAEKGLGRRWKKYLRASHVTDRNKKDRPQYQFYPHESVGDDEAPNKRGTVSQLQQKMAMGMRKCDVDRILQLFNWTEIDEAMLTQIPNGSEGGLTLASKEYKHACLCLSCSLQRPCWSPAHHHKTTQPVSDS
jgi:hypothetical protein